MGCPLGFPGAGSEPGKRTSDAPGPQLVLWAHAPTCTPGQQGVAQSVHAASGGLWAMTLAGLAAPWSCLGSRRLPSRDPRPGQARPASDRPGKVVWSLYSIPCPPPPRGQCEEWGAWRQDLGGPPNRLHQPEGEADRPTHATPQSRGARREACLWETGRTPAQEAQRHRGHGGVGARGSAPMTRDVTGWPLLSLPGLSGAKRPSQRPSPASTCSFGPSGPSVLLSCLPLLPTRSASLPLSFNRTLRSARALSRSLPGPPSLCIQAHTCTPPLHTDNAPQTSTHTRSHAKASCARQRHGTHTCKHITHMHMHTCRAHREHGPGTCRVQPDHAGLATGRAGGPLAGKGTLGEPLAPRLCRELSTQSKDRSGQQTGGAFATWHPALSWEIPYFFINLFYLCKRTLTYIQQTPIMTLLN